MKIRKSHEKRETKTEFQSIPESKVLRSHPSPPLTHFAYSFLLTCNTTMLLCLYWCRYRAHSFLFRRSRYLLHFCFFTFALLPFGTTSYRLPSLTFHPNPRRTNSADSRDCPRTATRLRSRRLILEQFCPS